MCVYGYVHIYTIYTIINRFNYGRGRAAGPGLRRAPL